MLEDADDKFAADLKALFAKNAAGGLLRSGSTIKNSVVRYEARMTEAVDLCCEAISTRHSKGGILWKCRFKQLRIFLDNHFRVRSGDIDPSIKIAGQAIDSSAARAGQALLQECRGRLIERVDDYANGWTASQAKPWHEKNPITWAMLLILAGAIAAPLVTNVIKSISNDTERVMPTNRQ